MAYLFSENVYDIIYTDIANYHCCLKKKRFSGTKINLKQDNPLIKLQLCIHSKSGVYLSSILSPGSFIGPGCGITIFFLARSR